jgi:hypothetical protein
MFREEAEPPAGLCEILVKAQAPVANLGSAETLALEDQPLGLPQPRSLVVLFLGV